MKNLSYICINNGINSERMNKRIIWDSAAKAGLAFGAISSVYMFATQFLSTGEMPAFAMMAMSSILWIAKFVGCIWLMMFFMKKIVKNHPEADNSTTFRFGALTGVLSALIYAAVSFANYEFISPDFISSQLDATMQQLAPMMDSNTMAQTEKMLNNMSSITFFSNLIYCSIYGILLSAILSRMIPSKDPFADYKPDEQ